MDLFQFIKCSCCFENLEILFIPTFNGSFFSVNSVMLVECYPYGAPVDSCLAMFPVHGKYIQAQISPAPYNITLSTNDYQLGEIISGTNSWNIFLLILLHSWSEHSSMLIEQGLKCSAFWLNSSLFSFSFSLFQT